MDAIAISLKNDVDLSAVEEWTFSEMFKDGREPAKMSGGSMPSGQNKFLLHRCDLEKLVFVISLDGKKSRRKND